MGRRHRDRETEAAVAGIRADLRSLLGSKAWTPKQMLGEAPPPMEGGSIEALEAQAAEVRAASAMDVDEAWADGLDAPALLDDTEEEGWS